jgi:hypothetical protein
MKLNKIVSIVILILAIASFFLYYTIATDKDANGAIDTMLNLTKFLLVLTAFFAIAGLIIDIFSSKKSLKYTLIGLGGFALVILIASMMGSDEPYKLGDTVYSASTSSWVDTGLWTFYLLGIIALGLMIFSWISDFFKTS